MRATITAGLQEAARLELEKLRREGVTPVTGDWLARKKAEELLAAEEPAEYRAVRR